MSKHSDGSNSPESEEQPVAAGDPQPDLEPVLKKAQKLMAKGDGWIIEECHFKRLRTDCAALGISGELATTLALRRAFSELPLAKLRQRKDKSYAGLEPDQILYDCCWDSEYFGRKIYLKFALNDEFVEIFTFHESKEAHP